MNNKALTLSLLMAVVSVFFVSSYVTSIEDEAKKKFGTEVLVLKAKSNIKEMDTINDTMFYTDLIPKRFLEPSAVFWEAKGEEANKDVIRDRRALVGSIAQVAIRKGEQITRTKITEPGIRTGLAPQVTPGRRGYAIPVTETSGVAKLVKPGDRIDLIAVLDLGGGKENKVAKTILQDVVVLATGRSVTNNAARLVEADSFGGKDKVRSLAEDTTFTPEQAQTLALVQAGGDSALTISLRNNDDTERTPLGSTIFMDVVGADASRVRVPAGKR